MPGKYTVKLLYGWDDKKFDEEYLKKLERNWNRWKNNREEEKRENTKRWKEYMKEVEEKLE